MVRLSVALSVLTRTPEPGHTKRRLIPALGPAGAAQVHRTMLTITLERAHRADFDAVDLVTTPTTQHPFFEDLTLKFGVGRFAQSGADLGERMSSEVLRRLEDHDAVVLVGSDCPGMTVADLNQAARWLRDGVDAVLGPSRDGGYYLLGLASGSPRLFEGLDWGTDSVAADTRGRFRELELHWRELPRRTDVDRPEDLLEYPQFSHHSST